MSRSAARRDPDPVQRASPSTDSSSALVVYGARSTSRRPYPGRCSRTRWSPAATSSATERPKDPSIAHVAAVELAGTPSICSTGHRDGHTRCPITPAIRGALPGLCTLRWGSCDRRAGSGTPRSTAALRWLKNWSSRRRCARACSSSSSRRLRMLKGDSCGSSGVLRMRTEWKGPARSGPRRRRFDIPRRRACCTVKADPSSMGRDDGRCIASVWTQRA